MPYCADCTKAANAEWYRDHRAKAYGYTRAWRASHRGELLARRRAAYAAARQAGLSAIEANKH